MVTKNFEDASQVRTNLPDILCDLKKRLGSSIGDSWKLTFEKQTSFSLQFYMTRYSNPGDSVKVDLLPTFDAKVEGNNGTYLLGSLCSDWSQETMTCNSSHCFSIVWSQVTSLPSSRYMTPRFCSTHVNRKWTFCTLELNNLLRKSPLYQSWVA